MKLLITGVNGQLGSELQEIVKNPMENHMINRTIYHMILVDRDELDITDASAVEKFFAEHKPDYCINAAAYTNVEKAEDEYQAAYAVNARGAENIARACTKHNAILFHISTDFVFDGKKTTPYTEDDEPHPLGAYARTKYEGELAVQEHCPRSFIIRTAWLYSSYGHNFVKTILRLCRERELLPVVADQYGSPTYARDLAEALLAMIDVCEGKRATVEDFFGIYHYVNDGEVTWFEFAQKIRDHAGGLSCELKPILASAYPSKVQRPAYSVLSTKKIEYVFGLRIPQWDATLEHALKEPCPTNPPGYPAVLP